MEFFTGLEANCLAGGDRDFSAGAGIATDPGLSRLDGEDTEASQFDAIALHQRSLHAFEDGVNSRFGFGAWQSGAFDNPLYQVLLNHLSEDPSLWIP